MKYEVRIYIFVAYLEVVFGANNNVNISVYKN